MREEGEGEEEGKERRCGEREWSISSSQYIWTHWHCYHMLYHTINLLWSHEERGVKREGVVENKGSVEGERVSVCY